MARARLRRRPRRVRGAGRGSSSARISPPGRTAAGSLRASIPNADTTSRSSPSARISICCKITKNNKRLQLAGTAPRALRARSGADRHNKKKDQGERGLPVAIAGRPRYSSPPAASPSGTNDQRPMTHVGGLDRALVAARHRALGQGSRPLSVAATSGTPASPGSSVAALRVSGPASGRPRCSSGGPVARVVDAGRVPCSRRLPVADTPPPLPPGFATLRVSGLALVVAARIGDGPVARRTKHLDGLVCS